MFVLLFKQYKLFDVVLRRSANYTFCLSFRKEKNGNYGKLYGTYLCQGCEMSQQDTNYVGG